MNDTPKIATDESEQAKMVTLPPKQSRDKEAESIRALSANASASSTNKTNRVARILDRYPQTRAHIAACFKVFISTTNYRSKIIQNCDSCTLYLAMAP
ncbi:hypothetical protein EMIT093MI4_10325 [Pseudomonas sp. IT-93MI4]